MRRKVGAALAVGLLAGCTAGPSPSTDPTGIVTSQEVTAAEQAELTADADLDPCPDTSAASARSASELPPLTLPCLGDGPDVHLAALGGKPYVLVVWAGWCVPCAEEAPYLQEAYEAAGDRVGFLGVDMLEPLDYGLDAAARWGTRFPSVHDEDAETRIGLRVQGPPTTVFVDADGRVVGQHVGTFESTDEVRAAIRSSLGIEL